MEINEIVQKLKSLKLNLEVHPENEPNSEFEDRISDLEEIIPALEKMVPPEFCKCKYGVKRKNYDSCEICGGKWKGKPKINN